MGQKVNPKIFRTNFIYDWNSKWFSKKNYVSNLKQDVLIRKFIREKLKEAGINKIEIERTANKINITIEAAKPGLIIGRGGVGIEELKKEIKKKFFSSSSIASNINILEVEKPFLAAAIVVQNMISDIEKRIPYRRVMKQAVDKVMKAGAKGVKMMAGGRLDGVEIARSEKLITGQMPLHTLRAEIDYSRGTAKTIYGTIGIKVWIYKGEVFENIKKNKI